jgi:glycosyltransferase involved in cell wall biosynthesis
MSEQTSTVCGIVKNEARSIAEWVAFQRVVGFDSVVVYDNGSTDGTDRIVADIGRHDESVSLRPWPDVPHRAPQPTAYADAIEQCRTDWIAFLDVDEFFVPRRYETVERMLAAAPADIAAIALNWRLFGSSGRLSPGEGLVIDRFTRCAARGHPKNRFCKSVVRPRAVETMRVHTAALKEGRYADSLLRPLALDNDAKTPTACLTGAQVNHYIVKSWEEFEEKRRRGNAARAPGAPDKFSHRGDAAAPPKHWRELDASNDFWLKHDLNDHVDVTILKWRQQVVERLQRWGLIAPGWVSDPRFERRPLRRR